MYRWYSFCIIRAIRTVDILKVTFQLLLAFLLLSYCEIGFGQGQLSIEPDASGEFIDLISLEGDNKYVHLVTSKGIYACINSHCQIVSSSEDAHIMFPNQSFSTGSEQLYYPLSNGEVLNFSKAGARWFKIGEEGKIVKSSNHDLWLINDSIQYKKPTAFKWTRLVEPEIQYDKSTDVATCESDVIISTAAKGVYTISPTDLGYSIGHYTTDKGLLSDQCTAVNSCNQSKFIVGHKAGLSIVDGRTVSTVSLATYTDQDIIEIESDKYGNIWCITATQLFLVNDRREINLVDLSLKEYEEVRAIDIGEGSSVNVLTSDRIIIVPKTEIEIFNIRNLREADGKAVQLYQIRNNYYYSDTRKVYALENNKWVYHKKKKAPKKVIHDESGNPYLIFANNRGKRFSKTNARPLSKIAIPEGESLHNICQIDNSTYYCTNTNLYEKSGNQFKLISHKEDAFYKVVSTSSGIFAFAENGIYRIINEAARPLLASYRNTTFPDSDNQFQLEDKLVTFNAESIRLIDTQNESILNLNLRPLHILDIKENGSLVWILCKKSLIAISKSELASGKIDIQKVIPLYHPPLTDGHLYKTHEDEIWIQSTDRLYRIDVNDPVIQYKPHIFLNNANTIDGQNIKPDGDRYEVQAEDLPIEFEFKSTNRWTDNINYAYYLNHEGKNTSEWTKGNIYEFNPTSNGKYTLTAKLKDDIYGVNIFNEDIHIHVEGLEEAKPKKKPLYWIPISILAGFLLWFLVKKI